MIEATLRLFRRSRRSMRTENETLIAWQLIQLFKITTYISSSWTLQVFLGKMSPSNNSSNSSSILLKHKIADFAQFLR